MTDSEAFILTLLAREEWTTTTELRDRLISAITQRDPERPFTFGYYSPGDGLFGMLIRFSAKGWVQAEVNPQDRENARWKTSPFGRELLEKVPPVLHERLGFRAEMVQV